MWFPWRRKRVAAQTGNASAAQKIPANADIISMSEEPRPARGQRSGPEYASLIANLALFCEAHINHRKINVLQANSALKVLKHNEPMFIMLRRAYEAGGEEEMKSAYDALSDLADEIVRISESYFVPDGDTTLFSSDHNLIVRQQGMAANKIGGLLAMQALAYHVRMLGGIHVERSWNGIGEWLP
jgi:hypothetical protein